MNCAARIHTGLLSLVVKGAVVAIMVFVPVGRLSAAPSAEMLESQLREHLRSELGHAEEVHGDIVELLIGPASILDEHFGSEWPEAFVDWYWESMLPQLRRMGPSGNLLQEGAPSSDEIRKRFQIMESAMSPAEHSLTTIVESDLQLEHRDELEAAIDSCRVQLLEHLRGLMAGVEYIAVDVSAMRELGELSEPDIDIAYARYDSSIGGSPLTSAARDQLEHDIRQAIVRARVEELIEVMHEASRRLTLSIFNFGEYYPRFRDRDSELLQHALDSIPTEGNTLILEGDPLFELYGHGTTFCHLFLGIQTKPELEPMLFRDVHEVDKRFTLFESDSLQPRNSTDLEVAPSFSLIRSRFDVE
jgi:hypothetical protein